MKVMVVSVLPAKCLWQALNPSSGRMLAYGFSSCVVKFFVRSNILVMIMVIDVCVCKEFMAHHRNEHNFLHLLDKYLKSQRWGGGCDRRNLQQQHVGETPS